MRIVSDTDTLARFEQAPVAPALQAPESPAEADAEALPAEAEMILSAMEAAQDTDVQNRRRTPRRPHHVRATLRLFANGPLAEPTVLYTRDVTPQGIGFISKEHVTLGCSGIVRLQTPHGRVLSAHCTVYRCRDSINGWYEGALTFGTDQPELA